MKYLVPLQIVAYGFREVEASSPEEAEEEALNSTERVSWDFAYDTLAVDGEVEVEEEEEE